MLSLMTRRDARSLDHQTLEEMRRMAVKCILGGEPMRSVAERMEVHYQTVWKWMQRYRLEGQAGLASTKASGRPPVLSETEVKLLRRIIVGKNPQQLNFGPALWTLPLIAQLVEMRFGVVLHATTISRILSRLGVTPQKPVRRAFQRDEQECLNWMTDGFPAIVREVQRKQAVLLFLDEAGVHEDHPVGTTWGVRGQTPMVRVTGKRRRVNVISAISPRGRFWFRCYRGMLTAPLYVEFLKGLLHDIRKRVVVIHDRHPAHVAAATRRFIADNKSRVTVYELPVYAPDLNPDEHVWSYVKGTFRRDPLRGDESIEAAVESVMSEIKRSPAFVKTFFEHPAVEYVRKALHWE
jgi:transposase